MKIAFFKNETHFPVRSTYTFENEKVIRLDGGGFVGPFNYNWQALKPMTGEKIVGIMNSSYNFQFAFWFGAIAGVPDWVKQHNDTYEALADMLDRNVIFYQIPASALKAFKQVSGKEPNYRKKHAAECDVLYAVLRAVWGKV